MSSIPKNFPLFNFPMECSEEGISESICYFFLGSSRILFGIVQVSCKKAENRKDGKTRGEKGEISIKLSDIQ
jgi:hypothetical protein